MTIQELERLNVSPEFYADLTLTLEEKGIESFLTQRLDMIKAGDVGLCPQIDLLKILAADRDLEQKAQAITLFAFACEFLLPVRAVRQVLVETGKTSLFRCAYGWLELLTVRELCSENEGRV